jgi:hypothetical protein
MLNGCSILRFELNGGRTELDLSGNLSDLVADTDNERDSVRVASGFNAGPFSGISDLETGPDGALYVVSIGLGAVYAVTGAGVPRCTQLHEPEAVRRWRSPGPPGAAQACPEPDGHGHRTRRPDA